MESEEPLSSCLVLIHVVPCTLIVYYDAIPATPTNNLYSFTKPLPGGMSLQ